MPANGAESTGFGSTIKNGLSSMAGIVEKAIIEIGDSSEIEVRKVKAHKPTTNKFGTDNVQGFNVDGVKSFATAGMTLGAGEEFELHGDVKKYRFEVMFNPEELSINGYGGEELPIQKFAADKNHNGIPDEQEDPNRGDKKRMHPSSMMGVANTHIQLSVKLMFDKSNPQDSFYADKFTLSQTSIGKGAARAIAKKATGSTNSVQYEVEALNAIVRDDKKRLVKFIWGDMLYEGVLNSVSAQYMMFNVNGEPVRASVSLGIVLYDQSISGANTDIWRQEYLKDIYSEKNIGAGLKPNINV